MLEGWVEPVEMKELRGWMEPVEEEVATGGN